MMTKKPPARQPSLFPKRAILQMLSGYYASGFGPNLRCSLANHAPSRINPNMPFDQPITLIKRPWLS